MDRRPIKKELCQVFGLKATEIRVQGGTGTAYGWVRVSLSPHHTSLIEPIRDHLDQHAERLDILRYCTDEGSERLEANVYSE